MSTSLRVRASSSGVRPRDARPRRSLTVHVRAVFSPESFCAAQTALNQLPPARRTRVYQGSPLRSGLGAELLVAFEAPVQEAPPSLLASLLQLFSPPPVEAWELDFGEGASAKKRRAMARHSHIAERLSGHSH